MAPLTEEEKARIEANRQRALELRAQRLRQQQEQQAQQQAAAAGQADRGMGVRELMSQGGFTGEQQDEEEQEKGTKPPAAAPTTTRVALAPTNPDGGGCEVCGGSDLDAAYRTVFGIRVCYACKASHEGEFGLVSKGEAAAEYCLQEGTIKVMPCLERRNPRHQKFQAMKLYCRKQLRAKALERWGGAEGLEEELARRRTRKYEAALSRVEVDVFANIKKQKAKP